MNFIINICIGILHFICKIGLFYYRYTLCYLYLIVNVYEPYFAAFLFRQQSIYLYFVLFLYSSLLSSIFSL